MASPEVDMRMVIKGKRTPLKGLIDQSHVHAVLLTEFEPALLRNGWRPENTSQFRCVMAHVGTTQAAAIEARSKSMDNTRREEAARSAGKEYVSNVREAFKDLRADHPDRFNNLQVEGILGGHIAQSTPALIAYLDKSRPHVDALEELLMPYFDARPLLPVHDALREELGDSQGTQETELKKLPLETRRLYEAMGILLHLIEKMNRLGKKLSRGDAQTAARFNKDLILRARKTLRAKAAGIPAE